MGDLRDLLASFEKRWSLIKSEDQTKLSIIHPTLVALGWEMADPSECVPEFSVGGFRVDYCFRLLGQARVFVEAKRVSESLDHHQEQLLNYAFHEGVDLAVLTNGAEWWLYLPTMSGSWVQRKFFVVNLREQDPEVAAQSLGRFLAKRALEDGSAVSEAKNILEDYARDVAISQTVPAAWNELCSEPDELLVDLLAEKVQALCGVRAPDETLAEFLLTVMAPAESKPSHSQVASPIPAPSPPIPLGQISHEGGSHIYTGTSPANYALFGDERRVNSWQEVLIGVASLLHERHPNEFERALSLKGRKRQYFARKPDDMSYPKAIPGSQFFVECNLSANDIVRRCHDLLSLFGHEKASLSISTRP